MPVTAMPKSESLPLFGEISFPTSEEEHFLATHLRALFFSKIARSQATGTDGVRVGRFAEKIMEETSIIEKKVLGHSYTFTRFKERLILRGASREPRQISIPTVRDRLALRAVCEVLHGTEPKSIGSSPHKVVDQVVNAIRNGDPDRSFVRVDVRNFFPSVTHGRLDQALKRAKIGESVRLLCLGAVKTPTGAETQPNLRGIPQGLSISGALSAIYMISFDKKQVAQYQNFYRYVDDILCICPPDSAKDVLAGLSKSLNGLGLSAHLEGVEGKTEISPVKDGIDFLGYHISINKVSIRKSSYKRMFKNMLKVITDYRYRKKIDRSIFRMNLKITGCIVDGKRRGWMMFFSRTEDMSQLSYLDRFIDRQLNRVKFPNERRGEIKTFIKSYHEIRYKIQSSKYIPNFDLYGHDEKIGVISVLTGKGLEEVAAWDVDNIENEFSRLISKEVHDLEQDVGNPS